MEEKKKIGIVTYWESKNNYGQQLQGWALQQYLRAQGYEPFLIQCKMQDYCPRKRLVKRIKQYIKETILWAVRNTPACRIHKAYSFCERTFGKDILLRRFDMFRERELTMTKLYNSYDELHNDPPKADIYSAGSDQIWADVLPEDWWEIAYLQFGDKNTKRISYAPSMPHPHPSDEQKRLLKSYLSTFSAISTREQSSTDYIRSLGFDSTVVVDPTLLLKAENYRKLYTKEKSCPSVFIYSINYTEEKEIPYSQIQEYARTKGLEVVVTTSLGYESTIRLSFDGAKNEYATIPQWLNRIDSANLIITPSFHGVVFAILMHRPFLFTPLIGQYAKGNERITELLAKLNLSNLIWQDNAKIETYAQMPIDWDDVDARLNEIRKHSEDYLCNAINL